MEQECEQQSYWADFLAALLEENGQLWFDAEATDELLERAFWIDGNERVN